MNAKTEDLVVDELCDGFNPVMSSMQCILTKFVPAEPVILFGGLARLTSCNTGCTIFSEFCAV